MKLIDYTMRHHANFKPFGPPYASILRPEVSSHHRTYPGPWVDGLERFCLGPTTVSWYEPKYLYETTFEEEGFPRFGPSPSSLEVAGLARELNGSD